MFRLFFFYLLLACSFIGLAQTTIRQSAYQNFHKESAGCDTIKIKNNSSNTKDWVKDQVGTTVPFESTFINFENGIQHQKFTFYNSAIKIKNTDGIVLYFSEFKIPKGDVLYIKGTRSTKYFSYDHTDNLDGGSFATLPVLDQAISIIYQQLHKNPSPQLTLSEIGSINQQQKGRNKKAFGSSGDCLINANCSEGDNWQDQKRSAVRILTKVNGQLLTCSGTIINNTAEDFTPYILTAEHCANVINTHTYSTAAELEEWIFYFNYESENCNNPSSESEIDYKTMTGATFVAQSHDMGGDNGSDFFLVKLKQNIPSNYCVFYSGWNRENTPAQSGVSIHHPKFDIKKISTFNSQVVSDESINQIPDTYWRLQWNSTTNGHSVTESGSSGGALFDQNKYLVGTLNGGNASCTNQNGLDWYGKFSYHWASNGTASNRQLKPHLDPLNTGVLTLNGTGVIQPTPQIHITASNNNVCDNETITFSIDYEQNQGATPSYQWFVNDILKASTKTFASNQLKNNDVVKVILKSSLDCVTSQQVSSNEVNMNLTPTIEPVIIIETNSAELCTGESATFNIQSQTGTGTYNWYLNDTLTVSTNTYVSDTLESQDIIKAILTSTEQCKTSNKATSNLIEMTVENTITPSITIELLNDAFPICENTPVTFNSSTVGIGQTGTIDWFKNNTYEGNGSTFLFSTLNENDSIRATLNSSLQCATSTEAYSDTLKATTTICTGISTNNHNTNITIYPNPVSHTLHIDGKFITRISIVNVIGQQIFTSSYQETIDCQFLENGVYILIIETENGQITEQIIKK